MHVDESITHTALCYSIDISQELRDLLEKLLQKDPAHRITIAEIREHPWVLKTARPLPSKEENCAEEIIVSEEEIKGAFKPFYTPIHILVRVNKNSSSGRLLWKGKRVVKCCI